MNGLAAVVIAAALLCLTGCAAEASKLDCKAANAIALQDTKVTADLNACVASGDSSSEFSLGVILVAAARSMCVDVDVEGDDRDYDHSNCERYVGEGFGLPKGLLKTEALTQGWNHIRSAAEKGEPDAIGELGFVHLEGRDGFERDDAKARVLLEKATAAGAVYAPYHLSQIYLAGYGGPRQDELGERYLRIAAERGHRKSWCLLNETTSRRSEAYRMIANGAELLTTMITDQPC